MDSAELYNKLKKIGLGKLPLISGWSHHYVCGLFYTGKTTGKGVQIFDIAETILPQNFAINHIEFMDLLSEIHDMLPGPHGVVEIYIAGGYGESFPLVELVTKVDGIYLNPKCEFPWLPGERINKPKKHG